MFKKSRKPSQKYEGSSFNKDEVIEQSLIDQQKNKINKKYEFPACFKKAMLHKRAVKFGYNAPKTNKNIELDSAINPHVGSWRHAYERPKLCACCNQPVNTKNINICYNTTNPDSEQKPFLLNSSAAMFFSFIKMAIIYLILVFMICGAFNLFTSVDGDYCRRHTQICQKSVFEIISSYNKHRDKPKRSMFQTQNILFLVVVVSSIIFFIIYRKIQYNIYDAIDAEHQTQDDYTLFIENIPVLDFKDNVNSNDIEMIEFNYENKLKDVFEQEIQSWIRWMKDESHQAGTVEHDLDEGLRMRGKTMNDISSQNKVTTISLCFDLSELQKINSEREALMDEQIALHKLSSSIESSTKQQIQNQIQTLNKIELNLCQKFAVDNSPIFNITHFVGKAFVTFQYQHYREYIMQMYQDGSKQFKIGNKTLTISRASHPTDISWTNMRITDDKRTRKVLNSYFIIAMVLCLSAAALVGIDFVKLNSIKSGTHLQPETVIINYGLSIIASIVATVLNYGIYYIVRDLTEYQKHQTMTHKLTSMIIKIFISQFINTAFIFYLIQVFNHRPYLSSAGLVVQVSFLIVISGFISILTNAVNIPYWLRYVKLWYKYGYTSYKSQSHKEIATYQIRLNKEYELPVFDIASRYSYYLLQVYTCMFYCYLVPVGVLAVAIIFGIQFWIDKIRMFRFSSEYNEIGYFLSRIILKMFEGSLLVFTIGNLIFSSVVEENTQINIINVVSFGLAAIYVCFISFAPTVLQRKVFAKYEKFQKEAYSQCLLNHKFRETYWTQNQATVFAKQVDINDNRKFMQQASVIQFCGVEDLVNLSFNAKDSIQQSIDDYDQY